MYFQDKKLRREYWILLGAGVQLKGWGNLLGEVTSQLDFEDNSCQHWYTLHGVQLIQRTPSRIAWLNFTIYEAILLTVSLIVYHSTHSWEGKSCPLHAGLYGLGSSVSHLENLSVDRNIDWKIQCRVVSERLGGLLAERESNQVQALEKRSHPEKNMRKEWTGVISRDFPLISPLSQTRAHSLSPVSTIQTNLK